MTAIATDSLTKKFAENFLTEINDGNDSNEYYIGIGKSDTYNELDTLISPVRSRREETEFRNNLQSVKKIEAASFVIPRYNWTSGSIYSGYDDTSVGIPTNSYYVLTEDNEVYICIQQGRNANGVANTSTVKPSFTTAGVSSYQAFETSDGYRWKFMYALSATKASNFLSSGFLPVQNVLGTLWNADGDSASLNTFELQQLEVQRLAAPKQITSVSLVSGGSGYSSAPTVTFYGNGTSAQATASIAGGSVVKIEMNNESAALGSGYDYASIEITGGGGTGASARPILSSKVGVGADALFDLKATSIMLNIKPDGEENGNFIVGNDFRQIGVLRNLDIFDSDARFTAVSGRALRFMRMSGLATSFTIDKFIRGASSTAGAYIDDIDSDLIYYHQNENSGFIPFIDGEIIAESDGSGTGTIDSADLHSIVDAHTGEVLYIENRARIVRAADQQEDIKVIITV